MRHSVLNLTDPQFIVTRMAGQGESKAATSEAVRAGVASAGVASGGNAGGRGHGKFEPGKYSAVPPPSSYKSTPNGRGSGYKKKH